jgi:hypothetical protein
MGPLIGRFQPQLHWDQLYVRAELETCQLGGPYPRSMQRPYPFWASDNPLCHIPIFPEPFIYGVYMVIWARKSPNIRSYTVYCVYLRLLPTLHILSVELVGGTAQHLTDCNPPAFQVQGHQPARQLFQIRSRHCCRGVRPSIDTVPNARYPERASLGRCRREFRAEGTALL